MKNKKTENPKTPPKETALSKPLKPLKYNLSTRSHYEKAIKNFGTFLRDW